MDPRLGTALSRLLLTAAFSISPQLLAAPLIPIEQFAASDAASSPSLSPDGTHLAYITHEKGKSYIMMYDISRQDSRPLLSGDAQAFTVSWCRFKNDERLLCSFHGVDYQEGRPFGSSRLVAMNTDGSHVKVLFQNGDASDAQFQDHILHWLPDDPHNVVIQLDDDGDVYPSVFKLDVYSGARRLLQPQRSPVVSWMTDRTGVVRFGFGYKSAETSAVYITRADEKAPWRVLEKFHLYDDKHFSPLGFGVRPNELLVSAPNNGRDAVWEFDLNETDNVQLVFANSEVDVDNSIHWPVDGHLLGFRYETDRPHAFYIDGLAQQVEATLQKVLPDRFSTIIGASRDGKRLLISTYSDVKPEAYYLLDIAAGKFSILASSNPQLEKAELAPMKTVSIPVGDVKIPGYLTVPVGKTARNLPTVVLPHGGPYARDSWGYDPLVQMMANRGYAVLQMNFRGSTGYGSAWFDAGWRGWGSVIHDDITAGAKWLVSEGIADPKRMCIVGWSYGGYAALLGVVKEPDLYKCAASIAGVSDLNQLKTQERFFYGGLVSARESIGANKDELKEISPLRQADRIKVPVLLVHGSADFTVLVSHSLTMAKELRRNHVPTDLVVIKDGDHQLDRQDMRMTLLSKLEAFLAANIGAP